MNWIFEKLLKFFLYPIRWFWDSYDRYREEQSILKIIFLFIVSLSGLVVFGVVLAYIMLYFSNHVELLIIIGVIIWVYAYIRSKIFTRENIQPNTYENQFLQEDIILQEQAIKGYPLMRNILYQTLKETAENIGGTIPRIFNEIELHENHFILSGGICFYQFKLTKLDIRLRYQREELEEFSRMLQSDISNQIQRGSFPTLGFQTYLDQYGNIYDAVLVDTIEDMDSCFIIQTVFYSALYADYLHQKNFQILNNDIVPDADWK